MLLTTTFLDKANYWMSGCKNRMRFAAACLILLLANSNFCWAETQQAQTAADHIPKICNSYNKSLNYWGPIGQRQGSERMTCPKNHAMMAVSPQLKRKYASGAQYVGISATCCPLPADDILVDEHEFSYTSCPDNFVVTGVFPEKPLPNCDAARKDPQNRRLASLCSRSSYSIKKKLRCTKINSKRYKLGPKSGGLKKAMAGHIGEMLADEFTSWKQIPVALRYGLGRLSRDLWANSTCVGYPWGSVFVGKNEKYCSENFFRQLQFQGLAQDPATGTPVRMYPDCLKLNDPVAKFPQCIN